MTELSLDGDGPLWQQIRRAIARPIEAGAWPPGARVPSEHELMGRFGAARMTVHRALGSLAADGLVERRRRAGTVVAARAPERAVFAIWDARAEIERGGGIYAYRRLGERRADRAERALLGDARAVRRVVCLHLSDGAPWQFEERLINLGALAADTLPDFTCEPPGRFLLRNVAWTEARHAIRAEGASDVVGAALGIDVGTPCLVVERTTWNGAEPVTFARLWHPSGHCLTGTFRPNANGASPPKELS